MTNRRLILPLVQVEFSLLKVVLWPEKEIGLSCFEAVELLPKLAELLGRFSDKGIRDLLGRDFAQATQNFALLALSLGLQSVELS